MDAPKGRYRIEEKDGRLVVTDTFTGAPVSSTPPSSLPSRTSQRGVGPLEPAPPGLLDRYGRLLLRLTVNHWDGEGRAVVAWEWREGGRPRRWDAALDSGQQKRLARALAAFSAFPLFVLVAIFAGPIAWMALPLALGATFWGVWSVTRLVRETGSGG